MSRRTGASIEEKERNKKADGRKGPGKVGWAGVGERRGRQVGISINIAHPCSNSDSTATDPGK
jgi:hypothetical protein